MEDYVVPWRDDREAEAYLTDMLRNRFAVQVKRVHDIVHISFVRDVENVRLELDPKYYQHFVVLYMSFIDWMRDLGVFDGLDRYEGMPMKPSTLFDVDMFIQRKMMEAEKEINLPLDEMFNAILGLSWRAPWTDVQLKIDHNLRHIDDTMKRAFTVVPATSRRITVELSLDEIRLDKLF